MSKKGENIYKRKDNRWEGRFIKGYDAKGKTLFGYVYAKTYREAKEKLFLAKQQEPAKKLTLKKDLSCLSDEWLLLSRNRVKESTLVKYRNIVYCHIKTHLGSYMPQYLNSIIIEDFSNTLLASGLSSKSVRDVLCVLNSILKYYKRQPGSKLNDIEIIYPKEEKKEMRVLSIEEQKRLIMCLENEMDYVKFGVLLALLTGMRIGEICALKWSDILLEEKIIKITSTMQRLQVFDQSKNTKTKIAIGEAKTQTSKRIVPLTEYATELCKKMQVKNKEAYVLTGCSNKFFEPRMLQYRLGKYTKACGLEGVHFHTLRHTFATRCVEVGFEVKSLSEVLGHASAKITLDRYVHSSLELKRTNMEKLNAVGL